jgi:integrase/recombinase XerD
LARIEIARSTLRPAQKVYHSAKQKSGLEKGKGIHTLRHCFATHLLESGVDLVTIKTLLGHNSLQSTQRYLQIRQPRLGATASPLDLLDPRDAPL